MKLRAGIVQQTDNSDVVIVKYSLCFYIVLQLSTLISKQVRKKNLIKFFLKCSAIDWIGQDYIAGLR